MGFLQKFDALPDDKKAGFLLLSLRDDPLTVLAELRAQRPILTAPPNFALVTKRRDVQDALNHNTVFTVKPYAPKMDPTVGPFMLARDDTVYNQRDKGVMRALMQQTDLPLVRSAVARLAAQAVADGATAEGSLDVVAKVTRTVPIRLTGEYFGFPGPDEASMKRWSAATQSDMFYNILNNPEIHEASVRAGAEMKTYLTAYLGEQAGKVSAGTAHDSVVTRLLQTTLPTIVGFDMARVMTNTMGLLVGGVETTSAAIAQALYVLTTRDDELAPALAAARSDDPSAFDGHFWEALRFYPQAPYVGRLLASDYVVGAGEGWAQTLPKGTYALLSHASAMMDESIAPDAGRFVADRPDWWYMHLGYGPHRCLGDQVSQVQAPEIARQILRAGYTKPAAGAAGTVDFKGGFFPESFTLTKA